MATDAELLAAGFVLPTGQDMTTDGDDALRANAAAAYEHARAVTAGVPIVGALDANDLPGGVRTIADAAQAAQVTNLPVSWPGTLRTYGAGSVRVQEFYPAFTGANPATGLEHAPAYVRRTNQSGGWRPWVPVGVDTSTEGRLRRDALRARVGAVRITTPAAVTLVLDHGLANVRDKVLPLLRARGLRATLALNSNRWQVASAGGVTAAEVKGWLDTFEVANHGREHVLNGDPVNDTAEVEGGRLELEAQLGVEVDTWVQTGNTGSSYAFADGDAIHKYWSTTTGRTIARTHALATGLVPHPTKLYPLDGHPKIGAHGYWIDDATATAQAQISTAIAEGTGVIIRLHPQFLDTTGKLSTAALTTFLDWLVARRDAGEVTVLPFREWSLAEPSTTPRSTGWRSLALGSGASAGHVLMRRVGATVTCRLVGVVTATASRFLSGGVTLHGFSPTDGSDAGTLNSYAYGQVSRNGDVTAVVPVGAYRYGVFYAGATLPAGSTLDGVFSWQTDDAWPTAHLPGTPA